MTELHPKKAQFAQLSNRIAPTSGPPENAIPEIDHPASLKYKRNMHRPSVFLSVLFFSIAACARPAEPSGGGSLANEGRLVEQFFDANHMHAPADPFAGVLLDESLIHRFDSIAAKCQVQAVGAQVECPPENRHLLSGFHALASRLPQVLDTFSWYLARRDERGQAVAVHALRIAVNNLRPQEPLPAIGAAQWERFLAAFSGLANTRLALSMDASLAAVAAMAGKEDAVERYLQRDSVLRARVIPVWMRFSRMQAFPHVRTWARRAMADGDGALLRACLESPARMPSWKPGEAASLCAWAREILLAGRLHVWSPVARLYRNCPLDHVRELAQMLSGWDLQFRGQDVAELGDLMRVHCRRPVDAGQDACSLLRATIEKAASHPGLSPEIRRAAQSLLQPDAH